MNNKIIKTVHSLRKLREILGIKSKSTIGKYINHVKRVYSPNLKNYINIKYPYIEKENLLTHNIIDRKAKNIPDIVIPNLSLFSLIPNILYVFNSDLSLVKTYNSIIEAVEDLNPNHKKLGISFTGRQTAISRYKNKSILIDNELGSFYFAKNPNSA
jgi:hypothetical protein